MLIQAQVSALSGVHVGHRTASRPLINARSLMPGLSAQRGMSMGVKAKVEEHLQNVHRRILREPIPNYTSSPVPLCAQLLTLLTVEQDTEKQLYLHFRFLVLLPQLNW